MMERYTVKHDGGMLEECDGRMRRNAETEERWETQRRRSAETEMMEWYTVKHDGGMQRNGGVAHRQA